MKREEIKRAAESVACGSLGKGSSPDQIELEIFRAFAQYGRESLKYALDCCVEWLESVESVKGE